MYVRSILYSSAALVPFLAASAVYAQTGVGMIDNSAPSANVDRVSPGDEIVVTGTRIQSRDYAATSPIVTVNAEALESTGVLTVDTALKEMPQFVASTGSTTNSGGNGGQANIQLRGLGRSRTLVLLDGRRLPSSNSDSSVDINIIPTAVIGDVEVITGGASAVYGSDAIAGVVNIITKRNFTGVEATARYGQSEHSDARQYQLGLSMGGNYADGRGSAFLSLEWAKRESIYLSDRAWTLGANREVSLGEGTATFAAGNSPTQAALDQVFGQYGVAPGSVKPGTGIGFNADGTVFATGNGVYNYRDSSDPNLYFNNGRQILADGRRFRFLQLPLERRSLYGRTTYDLSDALELFAQVLFTSTSAATQLNPAPATGSQGTNVVPTNPFLPDDLVLLLQSRPDPAATFALGQRPEYLGPRRQSSERATFQVTSGLRGSVGIMDWTWDLTGAYGRSTNSSRGTNYYSRAAQQTLLTAPDGGVSICSGGYNPFGGGPISDACREFFSREVRGSTENEQKTVEANLQGRAFDWWAGEVRFAGGIGSRSEFYASHPDSAAAAGDIPLASGQPFEGRTNVREIYGELLVPLLRDMPLVQEFSIDLGGRLSDYNSIGVVKTYKADADWHVTDTLRVRGGYERAIRAPNIGELFRPYNLGFPIIGLAGNIGSGDPCDINGAYRKGPNGAQVRALCLATGVPSLVIDSFTYGQQSAPASSGGNPDLREEVANTFSFGGVWRPDLTLGPLSGFSLSVDYYDIRLDGAIGEVPANLVLAGCFNADGLTNPGYDPNNELCRIIKRDGTGTLADAPESLFNLAGYRTSGIDFQVDWQLDLDSLSDNLGRVSFNVVGNYLRSFRIQTRSVDPFKEYAGTIGNGQIDAIAISRPRWKVNTSVNYTLRGFDFGLRWRHIGGQNNAANVGTSGTAPGVPSVEYFDASARVQLNQMLELSLVINNLTDRDPPFYPSAGSTDLATYDVIGRRYQVGIKTRF